MPRIDLECDERIEPAPARGFADRRWSRGAPKVLDLGGTFNALRAPSMLLRTGM
jgi:hypothetical protein